MKFDKDKRVTLEDYIHNDAKDRRYYVGTGKGKGFVFIGQKHEFEEWIDQFSAMQLEAMKKNLEKSRSTVTVAQANGLPKWQIDVKEDDFLAKLIDWETNLLTATKNIVRLPYKIKNYIPFRKRLVKEVYKKTFDTEETKDEAPDGAVAVIIDGDDIGRYWFYEEFTEDIEYLKDTANLAS